MAIRASSPASRAVTLPFAPGMTTMRLPPSSSTVMCAVPLAPSTVRRAAVSTPAAVSAERSRTPNSSAPTAPIITTFPPERAAATAWLAPLPPGTVRNARPVTVSPGRGALGT